MVRSFSVFLLCTFFAIGLACTQGKTESGPPELEPAIILTMSSEPVLAVENNATYGSLSVMTVNDVIQFHATDPRTNTRVDNKVTWSVGPGISTTDPIGIIDQTGKYTAPSNPSYVGVSASADSLNPPLRGGLGLEIVAAPLITSFTASTTTITNGQSVSLTPVFANGKGQLWVGTQVVQTDLISGTPVSMTPTATTTYTLVVTNLAGASVRQDLQIIVQ